MKKMSIFEMINVREFSRILRFKEKVLLGLKIFDFGNSQFSDTIHRVK